MNARATPTREEIVRLLEETFFLQAGTLADGTALDDFVRDSIDAVELLAVLSSEYGIAVDPAALQGVGTVGDVVRYVETAGRTDERVPLEAF